MLSTSCEYKMNEFNESAPSTNTAGENQRLLDVPVVVVQTLLSSASSLLRAPSDRTHRWPLVKALVSQHTSRPFSLFFFFGF